MKKRVANRVFGMMMEGVFLLSAAGCSNQPVNTAPAAGSAATSAAQASGDSKDSKVTIRIGGGPSSSANYTTFAGIGNLITKDHPNYLINTEISTGSQENIRMIQSGTVQFGVAMTDVEEAAAKGTREFEGSPVEICHVMGGYTTMLHMFVPKDSDIQTLADLKGKKLAVSKGAMAQYYMPILLEAYGLTKDDVQITETALQDICDAVNDGNADFGVHITPFTSSPIADLAATKGIRLLSIDDEHIEKISSENPYFYKSVIPGGTYTGVDEDTVVLGTRNNLVCAKSVDDEIVYNVVKSIIEHQDDLADVHPQANQFNKENAIEGALIDIHPGAAKYYKEIGLMN
ncbi:MAG: TAXI family TRAP transporter solute-binding subunit [Enterocloster asparagiformis]|nr:TAXI family TRAP transporter solute-binding subunit [Enterocloster asparagiformis]